MTKAKAELSTPHTSNAQKALIIEWLQVENNFKLITGSAASGKPMTSGTKLTKKDAYILLAQKVSKDSTVKWTAEQAKGRYESYLQTFKKAKKAQEKTGWGLTQSDIDRGIIIVKLRFKKGLQLLKAS
jgi:hypothetical protein